MNIRIYKLQNELRTIVLKSNSFFVYNSFNMKVIKIESSFTVYDDMNELPNDVMDLMQKAIEARKNAYAPYSKFQVGAAILLDNG